MSDQVACFTSEGRWTDLSADLRGTYARAAICKLYTEKTAITAADLLNDRVFPFFAEHKIGLLRVLTDLLGVQPIELLVVHDHFLALQHHPDPAIAKPAALGRDGLHLLAYLAAGRRAFAPDRLGIDTDKSAGPALRDVMIPHRTTRCLSPLIRRRQFFPSKSFRTA